MNSSETQIDKLLATTENVKDILAGNKSIGIGLDNSTIIKIVIGYFLSLLGVFAVFYTLFSKRINGK